MDSMFRILSVVLALLVSPNVHAVAVTVHIEQFTAASEGLQADGVGRFSMLTPQYVDYALNTDFKFFASLDGLGAPTLGSSTGSLFSLVSSPGRGYQAGDYAGFVPGSIALIGLPLGAYSDAINLAFAAGAIGAIVSKNTIVFDDPYWTFGLASSVAIPSLVISEALLTSLQAELDTPVSVPEPESLVLLVLALTGLAVARRRALM